MAQLNKNNKYEFLSEVKIRNSKRIENRKDIKEHEAIRKARKNHNRNA